MIQPFLLYHVNHVVVMLTSCFEAKFPLEKEGGLYQNKVNLSLTFTQRLGHQAHNCKMDYCQQRRSVWVPSGLIYSVKNSNPYKYGKRVHWTGGWGSFIDFNSWKGHRDHVTCVSIPCASILCAWFSTSFLALAAILRSFSTAWNKLCTHINRFKFKAFEAC